MALSDRDILREAARIRARQRVRLVKACASCGAPFEGIAQARYCSDACRMRAARERKRAAAPASALAPGGQPESPVDDGFDAALERLSAFRARTLKRFGPAPLDAAETVRRDRDERSREMAAW